MRSFLVASCLNAALCLGACGPSPRELPWEVSFGPGVDSSRALRVETRISAGGCEGGAELYAATVDPSAPTGPTPDVLGPGRYGFEAIAWDADCTAFAADCVEHTLPELEGEVVRLVLEATSTVAACEAARCEDGLCRDPPTDAGVDADAPTDAGPDTAPPPGPLVLDQALPSASEQMIDLPGDAVIVASGTGVYRQQGRAGGWVASAFDVEGAFRSGSVTARDGTIDSDLSAGSTLLDPVTGALFTLSHRTDRDGFDLVSSRWAWAAIDVDEVVSGTERTSGEEASASIVVAEDSVAIVHGFTRADSVGSGGSITLEVGAGGVCGRSTHRVQDTLSVPQVAASFFCVLPLSARAHTLRSRGITSGLADASLVTEVSHVLVPASRVPTFGTTDAGNAALDLPSAGVLVAYAWQRFTGGAGWAEVELRVGGSLCSRARCAAGPPDLGIGCVWPVSAAGAVDLVLNASTEGDPAPTESTLGWAFLPSVAP